MFGPATFGHGSSVVGTNFGRSEADLGNYYCVLGKDESGCKVVLIGVVGRGSGGAFTRGEVGGEARPLGREG